MAYFRIELPRKCLDPAIYTALLELLFAEGAVVLRTLLEILSVQSALTVGSMCMPSTAMLLFCICYAGSWHGLVTFVVSVVLSC